MNYKKILVSTIAVALIAMMFVTTVLASTPVAPNSLISSGSNTLTLRGSSTVYPISAFIKSYWQTKTGATLNLPAAEGSGVGLDVLASGTTDLAESSKIPDSKTSISSTSRNYWNSSRDTTYGMDDLRIWAVGKDSLAIVVSINNPYYSQIQKVCNASMISDLFCNTQMHGSSPIYPTWGSFLTAIGTPSSDSHPINIITRWLDSGTHDGFKTYFLTQGAKQIDAIQGGTTTYARNDSSLRSHTELEENQQVLNAVQSDQYSIGYIGLGFLEDNPTKIQGLWIGTNNPASNFIAPTKANALDGTYKCDGTANAYPGVVVMRWLWYATNGVPAATSEGALKSQFISYARMNRTAIDESGYLRIYLADFTGSAAPSFSTEDTGSKHPNLPDNVVNSADIAYFVNAYIAYYQTGSLNPYCDFNGDKQVNSADIAGFVNNYIKYYQGTGLYP
jgi:ABC-type phosphate transport system substrate-binding protein